jgi:hypothetical protein
LKIITFSRDRTEIGKRLRKIRTTCAAARQPVELCLSAIGKKRRPHSARAFLLSD